MDENIPLEKDSSKKFRKSVRGIQKLLKTGAIKPPKDATPTLKRPTESTRGLVYIGHIPHGFYEEQMKSYFKQFGKVTNAKVVTSAKTGRSKGYGFVEFANPEVAKIVAETMNNYLMGKRLLKAQYIPPEKNKFLTWKRIWNTETAPGVLNRIKAREEFNNSANADGGLKQSRNILKRLNKTKATLKSLGVDYDFFQPHDIPAELQVDDSPKSKESNITLNGSDEGLQTDSKKALKKKQNKNLIKKDKKLSSTKVLNGLNEYHTANKSKNIKLKKLPLSNPNTKIIPDCIETASIGTIKVKKHDSMKKLKNENAPKRVDKVKTLKQKTEKGYSTKIKNTIKKTSSKTNMSTDNIKILQSREMIKKKKSKTK